MSNLLPITNNDGLKFHVDTETNLVYASVNATARMLNIDPSNLRRYLKGGVKTESKSAEIQTAGGLQGGVLLSAEQVFELAFKYNLELAKKMGACGANVFMLGLSGHKVEVVTTPQTFAEALQLAADQAKALELKAIEIKLLEEETERQSEIIDELFDYSSIIRIAKYNSCSETAFEWRQLVAASKALSVEVKKAPCPRFVTKNLYHHDAWRLAYPGYRMPETTTLVITPPKG